jgi:PAS domain S-box-containing protein
MPEIVIKSETQKVAEAKVECFRSHLGPFVVAAETTRMAMVFMDAKEPGNPIIFANDAFLDLTGYDREEVLGQSFNFLMARGTDPDSLARIDIAFAATPRAVRKFATAARTATSSGQQFLSVRCGTRAAMSFSISLPSSTSPITSRNKPSPGCLSMS